MVVVVVDAVEAAAARGARVARRRVRHAVPRQVLGVPEALRAEVAVEGRAADARLAAVVVEIHLRDSPRFDEIRRGSARFSEIRRDSVTVTENIMRDLNSARFRDSVRFTGRHLVRFRAAIL